MASFVKLGKKIIAIGRNYAEHAKELNNAVPKEPFFFLKPTSSYLQNGGIIEIPRGVIAHHEIELGVVIGKGGRDISEAQADSHIAGYTLAIDMTARNMQDDVKKRGLPWTAAKGFDTFTPVGDFIPKETVSNPHDLDIWLKEGDLILTGTPAGVGPVIPGDVITAGLSIPSNTELLASLNFTAEQRNGGYLFQ
ncbi:hypothetical protein Clacol_006545 [Clathrus columnatus]|uniref:Fumarylacetoacetase-like C-terminal domain-containing protein n=1 Tax=Clathrus columnatus TaxID=1419009 RepID=A0AAV5AGL4_9AGAM|nr:hypothetical protein Clacol_006545 [Clathrus columnatus]